VRWAEVDMQKIVFNGHYLTYIDTAIAEYWREIGLPYPAGYVERYGTRHLPAQGHRRLSRVRALRRCAHCMLPRRPARALSMTFHFEIYRDAELLITAELST
jgi:acyl-CoA thioesterase FadM